MDQPADRSDVPPGLVPPGVLAAAPPGDVLGWLRANRHLTGYQADKLRRGHGAALILGPYRLLVPLARGGMGMVYLGAGPDDGPVAVKVLSPSRAARHPVLVSRFRREQFAGTRLPAHPHLVRQFDYGEHSGVEFLVLNHLPGRTVRQRLAAGPLPVGAACRAFADAAAGLHAAHAAGVVHRDLKPSNLMLGPTGRGTVFDFGLARMLDDPPPRRPAGPRMTVGTLDYLAPEQAADADRAGPPADLYALGAGLFLALTGRVPFADAVGPEAKMRAHREAVPPAVIDLRPDVPDELSELVRRLLGKHPATRPESAAEVASELERWADKPTGDPSPPRRPLAEVVAEAEAGWNGRTGDDTTYLDAVPPPPTLRLTRRQAVGLAAAAAGLVSASAVVGWAAGRF